VLAGRVRAATIQGAAAEDIAPSRRLYGGGGASVRGYGFQGVGPRDMLGNPTGGGSLVEFALEARIETPLLGGAIEVVPFIDAGSVGRGSTPDFAEIRFGAGVGLRYKTSFGPIRIDVAAPLNPTEFDSPVVVYVSLGQAF
jgi:translocation and assembly module TamA